MRYAVTGGGGSLGSGVATRLAELGHDVTILDREWPRWPVDQGRIRIVLGDLTHHEAVYPHLAGCDAVIHAGGVTGARSPFDGMAHRNNYVMTWNVVEAVVTLNIPRLINISSVQACGYFLDPRDRLPPALPFDESDTPLPSNSYALAKHFGEKIVDMAVAGRPELGAISIRFPMILAGEWMKRWLRANCQHPERIRRDFWLYIHRLDAIEACVRALQAPTSGHQVVYVFRLEESACTRTWQSLREEFLPDIPWRGASPDLPPVSGARMLSILGWKPEHSWHEEAQEAELV
jgi:UDP-glucose 4-epimerase